MLLICITITAFILIIGYIVICNFDENGLLKTIYLCCLAIVGFVAGMMYCLYRVNGISCEKKATAQGLEYRYGIWEGCLVKERDGNYIDYDRYRVLK